MNRRKIFFGTLLLLLFIGFGWYILIPKNDFSAFKAKKLRLEERSEEICLTVVGDIMLSRGIPLKNRILGNQDVFSYVKKYLKGDIVFGNLESPITEGREIKLHEMVFRADPSVSTILAEAGFNMLSLANNHIADFGSKGIADTRKYLNEAGIRHAGAGGDVSQAYSPEFFEVKELRLAFFAWSNPSLVQDSIDMNNENLLKAAIKKARKDAHIVIVSMHGGTEYAPEPDDTQIKLARGVIDAGADLVLGHHPHVVQKAEVYKGKYIFYSLGNFVFDQLWSEDTRESIIAKIFLNKGGVVRIDFIPVFIDDNARPQIIQGKMAENVLKKMDLNLTHKTNFSYTFLPDNFSEFKLTKNKSTDLDEDGIEEDILLKNGTVNVRSGTQSIWQSPENWWVDYFLVGDINNDGAPELNMLVWKEGSFGESKPFWIAEEDKSVKNHLFVFKIKDGSIKPVWQSSNLDNPNHQIEISDINGDSENELIAIEGNYMTTGERRITHWKWNGWGFSRIGLED